MRKGFSLMEILIAIVVMAVLAAIAFPNFSKSQGKNDARQAITYLRAIRLAEKIYYAKNGVYLACADDTAIKSNLGVEITTGSYHFDVTATPTTFFARTRQGGAAPANCTATDAICLDQAGTWSGGSSYTPTS